jgi:hypothetical protein
MVIGDIVKLRWGTSGRITVARVITRGIWLSNWGWQFESCGHRYLILDKEMTVRGRGIYVSNLLSKEQARR